MMVFHLILLFILLSKIISVILSCRHEDLKQMLDMNKDSVKLEAMKRIIGVSVVLFEINLTETARLQIKQRGASKCFLLLLGSVS